VARRPDATRSDSAADQTGVEGKIKAGTTPTLQDLEHRLERVESQHSDYVSVLSSHISTLGALVAQGAALQQTTGELVAQVGALRQDFAAFRRRNRLNQVALFV
jgi:hypothetical protein